MTNNIDEDYVLINSPLSQQVTLDGKTVTIDIYQGDDAKWVLEVVDQHNNSTVWDDQFDTDLAALMEALETIKNEGIDSLIGEASKAALRLV
jgi:hypothetical protein